MPKRRVSPVDTDSEDGSDSEDENVEESRFNVQDRPRRTVKKVKRFIEEQGEMMKEAEERKREKKVTPKLKPKTKGSANLSEAVKPATPVKAAKPVKPGKPRKSKDRKKSKRKVSELAIRLCRRQKKAIAQLQREFPACEFVAVEPLKETLRMQCKDCPDSKPIKNCKLKMVEKARKHLMSEEHAISIRIREGLRSQKIVTPEPPVVEVVISVEREREHEDTPVHDFDVRKEHMTVHEDLYGASPIRNSSRQIQEPAPRRKCHSKEKTLSADNLIIKRKDAQVDAATNTPPSINTQSSPAPPADGPIFKQEEDNGPTLATTIPAHNVIPIPEDRNSLPSHAAQELAAVSRAEHLERLNEEKAAKIKVLEDRINFLERERVADKDLLASVSEWMAKKGKYGR